MSILDRITRFHGQLSDRKLVWWPFTFLKPVSAKQLITWRRLVLMVPCFAGWLLLGWWLRALIVGDWHMLQLAEAARVYLYLLLGFTLWFTLVTAPLWNRRARALDESARRQRA